MAARRVTKTPDQPLSVKSIDVQRIEHDLMCAWDYISEMGDTETKWLTYSMVVEIMQLAVRSRSQGTAPGSMRPIFDTIMPAIQASKGVAKR